VTKGGEIMVSFKGAHFPKDMILTCVRWYLAYPLSSRHIEELMQERGVSVDHATINRWVVKYSPQLEAAFHRRKRPVWVSWRMDETYIKVNKAVRRHGVPEKITIEGSEANAAATRGYNDEQGTAIAIRQVKYLNNLVEQDHRAVKRLTRPMLGFKSFEAAPCTLAGVELMHMIRKGQLASGAEQGLTAAEQFYSLAA
jgi:putative transposase